MLALKQTWQDHLKIIIYHTIEPILLGCAIGLCMQNPSLSSLIYIVMVFLGMIPLILTSSIYKIKFKIFQSFLMLFIALAFTVYKSVIYAELQKDKTRIRKEGTLNFIGIFPNDLLGTMLIDSLMIITCMLLICHYYSQK